MQVDQLQVELLQARITDQVHGIDHIRINSRSFSLLKVKGQIVSTYEKIFGRDLMEIHASAALRDFSRKSKYCSLHSSWSN